MNAKEAAQNAKDVRTKRAEDHKKHKEKKTKEFAASWRKERADFLIEFYNDVEECIKDAVKDGKKSCIVDYLGKAGGAGSPVEAQKWYETSRLRDIIEKVFRQFRGKGFSIKIFTGSSEHYVNYETSNDMYSTYHTNAKITWEE